MGGRLGGDEADLMQAGFRGLHSGVWLAQAGYLIWERVVGESQLP